MMLQLPVELKLMILRQLPREDLFALLTVSKEVKALVHPLFYERMLLTRAGFAFPHAPNPYPFLDIPNLKSPTPVSDEERDTIMNGVRSVTIASHHFAACAGWQNIQTLHRPLKADVLTIELAYPSLDGISGCHKPVSCGRCGRCQMFDDDDDHLDDDGHPFPDCGFVDALHKLSARKIIVKNYPALLNGEGVCLQKLAESATEFVVVLEPISLMSRALGEGEYFADACPDGSEHLGATAVMGMIPRNVKNLTLVFMTRFPGAEWGPDCKHYNLDWYDRGCTTPCPCGGGCHDNMDMFDELETEQMSCWQSEFWKELARGIADSKARVTIVNYSAIIPDGVNRYDALKALDHGKRRTVRKKFLRELRKAHESKEAYDARLADVRLVSMENWIHSGAWEDVFERKEVSRWLDRVEKLKAKAKWKAIAKKPEPAKAATRKASAEPVTPKPSKESAELKPDQTVEAAKA